ncbi:MAG: Sec61beta family [archaeon]|jgi:preprotein translocase subunit Sec61beta
MVQEGVSMPGMYGGLMRYNEEYESAFKISPEFVVVFVIAIVLFVTALKMFWPLTV